MRGPDYLCAIIVDRRGRLVFEHRYPRARHAPGRMTCYGGRRCAGEGLAAGLRRELREELAWNPRRLGHAVDLVVAGRWIARFRVVPVDPLPAVPRRGPGGWARVVPAARCGHPLISRWHRAVVRAWRQGRTRVAL